MESTATPRGRLAQHLLQAIMATQRGLAALIKRLGKNPNMNPAMLERAIRATHHLLNTFFMLVDKDPMLKIAFIARSKRLRGPRL